MTGRFVARRNRGVALILVLWFVVLLAVLALGLSKVTRNGALLARQLSGATQARYLSAGAIQMVQANLLMAPDEARLLGDGEEFELSFKQGKVLAVLWNESGKIDINRASETLLARFFEVLELPLRQSENLAGAIADWRDEDDLVRLHGAEEEDYFAAGFFEGAGDRPFISIVELRKVLGMDENIYQQIEPYVTVYSQQQGINPEVASMPVLLAISDDDASAIEHYVVERRRSYLAGLPLPPAPTIAKDFLAGDGSSVYSLSAMATTLENISAGQSVVFELSGAAEKKTIKILDSQPYALTLDRQDSLNEVSGDIANTRQGGA